MGPSRRRPLERGCQNTWIYFKTTLPYENTTYYLHVSPQNSNPNSGMQAIMGKDNYYKKKLMRRGGRVCCVHHRMFLHTWLKEMF